MTGFEVELEHIIEFTAIVLTILGGALSWLLKVLIGEIRLLRQHIIKMDRRQDTFELRMALCKTCPSLKDLDLSKSPSLEEESAGPPLPGG